jgi:hypothetical protein
MKWYWLRYDLTMTEWKLRGVMMTEEALSDCSCCRMDLTSWTSLNYLFLLLGLMGLDGMDYIGTWMKTWMEVELEMWLN